MSRHDDLTMYMANMRDDSDAKLECYFDDYSNNLWHAYVNGAEIFNLLSDTVIQSLEQEYVKHRRSEADAHNLELAIDRHESQREARMHAAY